MVPFYQLAVDLVVGASLLYLVIVGPFLLKRPLPLWANILLSIAGLILLSGVTYALVTGHWPFRG